VKHFRSCILALYRRPSGCFDTFLTTFEKIMSGFGSGTNVIIAGDFNIHFNTGHTCAMRFGDAAKSFGLRQTVFQATRMEAWVDNLFVSRCVAVVSVSVVELNMSDHLGQVLNCVVECVEDDHVESRKICRPITQRGLFLFFNKISCLVHPGILSPKVLTLIINSNRF